MATIDLDTKKESDRRLALLALTNQQPEPSSPCLDAEELACLVEGQLAPEKIEVCLAHLTGCEQCYATWRQLDQEWQQQPSGANRKRGMLLRLFSRPRFLATAGSILAVAASIAVFLNITMQTDRDSLLQFSTPLTQKQKHLTAPPAEIASEPANSRSQNLEQPAAPSPQALEERREKKARVDRDHAMEQKTAAKPSAMDANRAAAVRPAPSPAVSGTPAKKSEMAAADKRADKSDGVSEKEAAAPAPAPPQQAMPAAGSLSGRASVTGLLTLAEWQRMIREGCQGQPGPDFFGDISVQGRKLLARHDTVILTQEERRQVSSFLTLLADQHQQTASRRCQALLAVLGPLTGDDKQ